MTTHAPTTETLPLSPDGDADRAAAVTDLLTSRSAASAVAAEPLFHLTSGEADPVFQTGLQIGRLVAQHGALDAAGRGDDVLAEQRRELAMNRADKGANLLLEAVAMQVATSVEGALAHVVTAGAVVVDMIEDDGLDEDGLRALALRARRCLYSASRALSLHTGVSLRALGAGHFMSPCLDDIGRAWGLLEAPVGISPAPAPAPLPEQAILDGWLQWHAVQDHDAEDETPAEAAAYEARWALTDAAEALPATPENLHAKALALAWLTYTTEWTRGRARVDYATNGRLALDIQAIVTRQATPRQRHPDPVHGLIAASRAAEAEMAAFQKNSAGRMTDALFAEEERLGGVQSKARDAALAATPTTRAGQLAMLAYVRFQMGLHGYADGEAPDPDSRIWATTRSALERTLEAGIDRVPRSMPDLSACSIQQLRHLYDVVHSVWLHASAETQSPWCWNGPRDNYSAAGKILDGEAERWATLLDQIDAEARRRTPFDNDELNDRLSLLLRHELGANDRIANQALLAEAATAWGAPARG